MNLFQRFGARLFGVNAATNVPQSRARKSPHRAVKRMYAGAENDRNTSSWNPGSTSGDAELQTSLTVLRNRARALVRDASYVKRARTVIVNNVVGSGIGLQAQVKNTRGKLIKKPNAGIETAWAMWIRAENCHTGGTLHFNDLERLVMMQVFEAGEVFIRIHRRPFGPAGIPFTLELVEAERVPDRVTAEISGSDLANTRMGVKVDRFMKPLAYWVRDLHQADVRYSATDPASSRMELVPAADMIHVRLVDRWPQTRGVPWLHVAMKKLNDMEGYTEAEIIAARAAANVVASRKEDDWDDPDNEEQDDGSFETELEPGTIYNGDMTFFSPNRPNSGLDAFMRYMLREVAAGLNVSYESLSRDYSQSNYSSSRLALLDDRDVWRTLQTWFVRSFRDQIHRQWLQAAVFSGNVQGVATKDYMTAQGKYEAAKFKTRGWSWVDPQKEVKAYKEAIMAGLTTRTQVIAATAEGRDVEELDDERAQELDSAKQLGLSFDTDPGAQDKQAPPAPASSREDDDDEDDDDTGSETKLKVVQ